MNIKSKIVFCISVVLWFSSLYAQEDIPKSFFAPHSDSSLFFYFDRGYFLVEKECEYRSINRIAGYNSTTKKFHGDFTDYDINGNIILIGHYKDGKKTGMFKAFHPNGTLKWEVLFNNDYPTGDWHYYYPDGKPFMSINYPDLLPRIISVWNKSGKLIVKNGNGNYEFSNPFDFYSEYGHPFYRMSGLLVNGLAEGDWDVLLENKGKVELESIETYSKGKFVIGHNISSGFEYVPTRFSIIPSENFSRAESFLFKHCTFDDHTGFKLYLSDFLNTAFYSLKPEAEINTDFSYQVHVNAKGDPKNVKLLNKLPNFIATYFEEKINEILYYIPSYKEDKYIDDILTISAKIRTTQDGRFDFIIKEIHRENEGSHQ